MLPQNRKRKAIADDTCVAKKQKQLSTAHTYQQIPQLGVHHHRTQLPVQVYTGQQTATRPAPKPQFPQHHVNAPTNVQIAAYEDAVITNAWHEEWHKEPERFGPARPLRLLNQPARINLAAHPLQAKGVHLNHWDCKHEPEGAIAQHRIQEQEGNKRREQMSLMEAMEQEHRRGMVKHAAQSAHVIDLTEDDVASDTGLCMYQCAENTENHSPDLDDRLWDSLQGIVGYDDFFARFSADLLVQNPGCYTTWIPQNGYSSQQNYGVF